MDKTLFDKAVELRHEIHAHPDLSNQERPTFERIIAFLRENAPSIEILDRGHYVLARYKATDPKKPPIAFRADVDAILVYDDIDKPWKSTIDGVGHKCGHDGHAAALAALAMQLDKDGADRDVYMIFQPAEENGTGSAMCTDFLTEFGIAEIYGFHSQAGAPKYTVMLRDGLYCCASKGMTITMTGSPAHASQPEDGKNPSEAIAKTVLAVSKIADQANYKGLVLATIVQIDVGEKEAFGVAASKGKLLMTIRGEIEAEMDLLQARLEDEAMKNAAEYGLACQFSYCDAFPETVSTPACNEKLRKACDALGYKWWDRPMFYRGSEDFGNFTKVVPGAMFFISNGEDGECDGCHTLHFDFNDELIDMVVNIEMELIRA
ncbi:MAG: amidohydrolase [Firmicutes bacterium]|nr:amidohydrolase [Bacillota bacterium]MBQ4003845.1 amidohydrolase [Bacillota bacterium]